MYTLINERYNKIHCQPSRQVAMRALGFEVRKVDVLKILKDYDREGTGKISFNDFSEVGEFQSGFSFCIIIMSCISMPSPQGLTRHHYKTDRPKTKSRC